MRAMLLPKVRAQQGLLPEQRENRRLGDALFPNPRPDAPQPTADDEVQFDAAFTVSDREVLRKAPGVRRSSPYSRLSGYWKGRPQALPTREDNLANLTTRCGLHPLRGGRAAR